MTLKKRNKVVDKLQPYFEKIYQYPSGEFLPNSSQPNPKENHKITTGEYTPHFSTRYMNVVIGSNGIAQSCKKDCAKHLPELYVKREDCCGCSACYAICPTQSINMRPDEEGFFYPVVDATNCVRCYKCVEVCPIKQASNNDKKG
ncbi:MAG: 4Fe-4S dicluster domain-containing protein [Oscillospiraceae bacterium]|nr:4Fe-4S dicluster domain-containing protein [Oscillospiraceae bacterium]